MHLRRKNDIMAWRLLSPSRVLIHHFDVALFYCCPKLKVAPPPVHKPILNLRGVLISEDPEFDPPSPWKKEKPFKSLPNTLTIKTRNTPSEAYVARYLHPLENTHFVTAAGVGCLNAATFVLQTFNFVKSCQTVIFFPWREINNSKLTKSSRDA